MASQSSSVEFLSANTRTWHGSKESTKSIARVGRKDESLRSVRSIPVHDFRSHPRPKLPASHLCLGSLGRVAVLKFHTEVWAGRGSLVESSSCSQFLGLRPIGTLSHHFARHDASNKSGGACSQCQRKQVKSERSPTNLCPSFR